MKFLNKRPFPHNFVSINTLLMQFFNPICSFAHAAKTGGTVEQSIPSPKVGLRERREKRERKERPPPLLLNTRVRGAEPLPFLPLTCTGMDSPT